MKKIWPVIVLLFLLLCFFYRQFFLNEVFYFGDNLSLILPFLQFLAKELKRGHFPLWNPYLFSGLPFLSEIALGVLNPLSLMFLIFPPLKALTWEIILEVLLANLFCYWYLRALKITRLTSILGAIVFGFSASILTFINNLSLLSSAYLLPLVLFVGQKTFAAKKYFPWTIILAIVMVWQFISGHPQIFFYTFITLYFYLLFWPEHSLKQKINLVFISFALFLLLSAFAWLPFFEAISLSTRPLNYFDYITSWSLHPLLIIRLFLPHFFGVARQGFSWGPAYRLVADNTGYFGLLPFFVIILGWLVKKPKKYEVTFFTIVFFLSIFLAMGKYTPVFSLFYRFFPGFRLFRSPTQILLLTDFSAAVLLALLWRDFTDLLRNKFWLMINKITLIFSSWFLIFLGVINLLRKDFFIIFYGQIERIYFYLRKIPLSSSPFHNFSTDKFLFEFILNHLFVVFLFPIAFLLLILVWQKRKINLNLFTGLSLLLIFVNLLIFNRNNFFSNRYDLLIPDQKVVNFLDTKYPWRIISSAGYWPFTGLNVYWENISLRPPFAPSVFNSREQKNLTTLNGRLRTLPPNWGMVYSLATPMGYGDLIPENYASFMSQKTGRVNVNEVDSLALNDNKLNLLGVRYLLVDSNFETTIKEVESFNQFSFIKQLDNVRIYENKLALPRAFLVDNGKFIREAEIIDYQTDKVKLKISSETKTVLVLTDVFYPGWKVLVNGKEKKIETYQNAFRMVQLEPGDTQIEFKYQPKSFFIGSQISFVGIILVCLISFVNLRKKFSL